VAAATLATLENLGTKSLEAQVLGLVLEIHGGGLLKEDSVALGSQSGTGHDKLVRHVIAGNTPGCVSTTREQGGVEWERRSEPEVKTGAMCSTTHDQQAAGGKARLN
jgi:hypothetical protein